MKRAIIKKEVPFHFDGALWHMKTLEFEVTVLSVVGIWAMVRKKGCAPFVTHKKCLKAFP